MFHVCVNISLSSFESIYYICSDINYNLITTCFQFLMVLLNISRVLVGIITCKPPMLLKNYILTVLSFLLSWLNFSQHKWTSDFFLHGIHLLLLNCNKSGIQDFKGNSLFILNFVTPCTKMVTPKLIGTMNYFCNENLIVKCSWCVVAVAFEQFNSFLLRWP